MKSPLQSILSGAKAGYASLPACSLGESLHQSAIRGYALEFKKICDPQTNRRRRGIFYYGWASFIARRAPGAPRPWRAAPLIALRPLFFDFVSDLQASSTACPIRRSIPGSSAFLHRALRRPIHWRELVTLPAVCR